MNPLDPYFASDDPAVEAGDDIDLLLRISYRAANPTDAEAAFVIFFYRHAEFLRLTCVRYKFCHPAVPAESVVTLALAKVFNGEVNDFKVSEEVKDQDDIMRLVRAWLIEIAKFAYFDERKKVLNRAEVLLFDDSWEPLPDPVVTHPALQDDEPPPPTAPERTAILALRDSLSSDDQLLLDRSMDYFDPASGDCKVPPSVARALAYEFGISVPGVRKRRERLFARIKAKLEENRLVLKP